LGGFPCFLEIKDGAKPLSAQRLTKAQEMWHSFAHGITFKVRNLEEALDVLGWAKARHLAMVLAVSAINPPKGNL
jgi:hypothetical protein